MAKGFRGGFGAKSGGGGNNMQKLMQQAQAMQKEMEKEQAAIAEKTFEGTAGGGVVKVVMTGEKKLQSLEIKPEAVDPEDVEMLQDLITAAFNECIDAIDNETQEVMGKYTMGL
ncbi:MAG: YbaB/EbfC family nucleoid-associated protein [Clostridiales bacterium]|jgi:DNA-binding protein, ybaB/ebfC family|nr:YbaB/EbfC family nucleoid-associated protein [Clostridiales bacterium]